MFKSITKSPYQRSLLCQHIPLPNTTSCLFPSPVKRQHRINIYTFIPNPLCRIFQMLKCELYKRSTYNRPHRRRTELCCRTSNKSVSVIPSCSISVHCLVKYYLTIYDLQLYAFDIHIKQTVQKHSALRESLRTFQCQKKVTGIQQISSTGLQICTECVEQTCA